MSVRIKNGGLELFFLEEIEKERGLSESELSRKTLLDSLPKGEWVYLDDKANPIPQVDVVSDFLKRVNHKDSTNISVDELKKMSDSEIIDHCKKYPYPSQWTDKKSSEWVDYHLATIQGRKYMQIGNLKSFSKTTLLND